MLACPENVSGIIAFHLYFIKEYLLIQRMKIKGIIVSVVRVVFYYIIFVYIKWQFCFPQNKSKQNILEHFTAFSTRCFLSI